MFTAQIKTISGSDIPLPFGVRLDPQTYSWSVYGGPLQADVDAVGPQDNLWALMAHLGRRIEIYDDDHAPVWWGIIEEILVNRGGLADGLSIRQMYNQVKVLYTYTDGSDTFAAETDWASDAESINAFGFTKEYLETLSQDATSIMANTRRDNLLRRLRYPNPTSETGGGGDVKATLHCVGDFHSLGWRYCTQPLGLEYNEGGSAAIQEVGQGLTSNLIAFSAGGKIHDLGGRFQGDTWRVGAQVRVSGSSNNNVTGAITATDSRQLVTYSTDGMSFEVTDDLISNGGLLSYLQADDFIRVTGTTYNDDDYRLASAGAEACTVRPKTLTGETTSSGTITRGNWIQIDSGIVNDTNEEFPGNTTTVQTFGNPCVQSFLITTADWTLNKIELRGYKVGSPNDSLKLELCQNNNGNVGPVVESVTVAASAIAKEAGTIAFQLSNTTVLNKNLLHWLRITRTGAVDPNSYFVIAVEEQKSYSRGVFQVWDGISYVPRDPDCDLVFWATGAAETTTQIQYIVEALGQFVTKVDILANSGVWTPQYRDGSKTGYDEIMELLNVGTVTGEALFAYVTADQILRIFSPAPANSNDIQQTTASRYLDEAGRPLKPGYLPVGRWINRSDIPLAGAEAHRMTPRLCQEAEYDCQSGEISSITLMDALPQPSDSLFGVF